MMTFFTKKKGKKKSTMIFFLLKMIFVCRVQTWLGHPFGEVVCSVKQDYLDSNLLCLIKACDWQRCPIMYCFSNNNLNIFTKLF